VCDGVVSSSAHRLVGSLGSCARRNVVASSPRRPRVVHRARRNMYHPSSFATVML
jgi:hypothetical protein